MSETPSTSQSIAPGTRACLYCDSTISERAKVCPVCQRVQNKLRNQLVFYSSMIGLFSFALAIISTTYKEIHDLYRAVIYGDQIITIDLQTNGQGVFYNNGYRTLYLVRLDIEVPLLQYDQTINLFKPVTQGQFASVALGELKNKRFVTTVQPAQTDNIASLLSNPSHFPGVTLSHASDYQHQAKRETIPTYPCKATLYFLPPGEIVEHQTSVECIGVIYAKLD